LDETPVFEEMEKKNDIVKTPLFETLFKEPKSLLLGIGLKITEVTWAYLLTIFVVGYAVVNMEMSRSEIMDTVLIASAINLIAIPFFGWLSDVVGRRPLYIWGSIISIAMAYPLFGMLQAGQFLPAMIIGMLLGNAVMMAPLSSFLPETFKSNIRFTGASFGCQVAAAIGGGIMPGTAAVLAAWYGGLQGVAFLMIALSVITLIAAFKAKETANTELVG
jgi:MHS family shikimate/dehydroshikimate transporter-like MFS transporter